MRPNLSKLSLMVVAMIISLTAFGQSYEKIIPRPQVIKPASGTHHHRSSDVINVKFNSKVAEEGYILKVTPSKVTIEASSSAGIFYAKQTLSQMAGDIFRDVETSDWTIDCCTIKDEPRFPYRGLHLDVSRHFRSKEYVKKQLDAMARMKLNKFHFHLTDAEGWRLQIDSYPLLTDVAAWRPLQFNNDWRRSDRRFTDKDHGFGGYYTKDDIREIVAYAQERHITVIPEIEIPGHSYEVCAVYPQVSCSGVPFENSVLCPGKEETFEFIEKVLTEVMEIFPSEYIHIGGDEASKKAWKTCPDCQRRIKEEGLKDEDELQSYTIRRVERFVESKGRHIIGWDEILEGGLAPNATVMSWRGISGGNQATEQGHDAIMTPNKYCYIDAAQDKPDKEPAAFGVYLPLQKIYDYDPVEGISVPSHIIGVQANLWSEYIVSDEYAEYMTWPRGLAIAEIGWTRPENKDGYDKFRERALDVNDQFKKAGYYPFDLRSEAGNRPEYNKPTDHLAVGCKVTYNNDCKWNGSYPATQEATFTDGRFGGWSYRDDRWQGFLSDIDVTIDLGESKEISHVEPSFYNKGWEMMSPVYTEIQISEDGVNFKTVAQIGEKPKKDEGQKERPRDNRRRERITVTEIAPYQHIVIPDTKGTKVDVDRKSFDFNAQKARYVRMKSERGSFGGWIFIDEIIVK